MLPWFAVRVHDLTRDDLGIALVRGRSTPVPNAHHFPLARTRAHARQAG